MVAMRHAERILALSSELKLMIKKLYGVAEERFVILPNSVDTRMFSCGEASLDVIERLGVRGRKIILYSGSLTPLYRRRGIRFLIKAMPGIVSEESRALLLIVGPVGDGVRRELEDLACSVNVGEFVRFVEAVPYEDMPRYISVADVCVGPLSPSLDTFGSTPRKVVEYLACGKPVIVCRGGVARDLIVDRRTGFLVRYGDVDGLASCVLELFRNQRFARKVGRQGRLHAVTFYDQRVLADRLDREIRDLLLNY
jgi:glycosyltransferase involved in cell wall biosynthesis